MCRLSFIFLTRLSRGHHCNDAIIRALDKVWLWWRLGIGILLFWWVKNEMSPENRYTSCLFVCFLFPSFLLFVFYFVLSFSGQREKLETRCQLYSSLIAAGEPHVGLLFVFRFSAGAAGILWFVAWQLIVHESPSVHPTISEDEKNYIERGFDKGMVRMVWAACVDIYRVMSKSFCKTDNASEAKAKLTFCYIVSARGPCLPGNPRDAYLWNYTETVICLRLNECYRY